VRNKPLRATIAIGNSHCSLALWKENGSVDETRQLEISPSARLPLRRGETVLICSVVPRKTAKLLSVLKKKGAKAFVFRKDILPDIDIIPEPPERVGSDRIAGALGALSLDASVPWVIADIGTAVTCNAVTPARGSKLPRFEGGLIAPGAALSFKALAKGTAQLPEINSDAFGDGQDGFVGTSTEAAMRGGVAIQQLAGLLAMIEGQRAILGPETRVALTGGGAQYLKDALERSPHRRFEIRYEPLLVHLGLKAAWSAVQTQ